MNTKTMEGLVGAGTNINMVNTPLRIYKEARRQGDTAKMERAMGYVGEFSARAQEYKAEAGEGLKEDEKEAREKAELEREKAIQKRKEEREKLEESREDRVEISGDGMGLLEDNTDFDNNVSPETKTETTDDVKEPVTYTKMGEVNQTVQSAGISISV